VSTTDDHEERMRKIEALWLLLRPTLEERARELEASPFELAMALTIGTPSYVYAAVTPDNLPAAMAGAAALFEHTCLGLVAQGEH
jgi:hypothetical protein